MRMQPDLFDDIYSHAPGWKETDTSRDAAEAVRNKVDFLRGKTLSAIWHAPDGLTADEAPASSGNPFLRSRASASSGRPGPMIDLSKNRAATSDSAQNPQFRHSGSIRSRSVASGRPMKPNRSPVLPVCGGLSRLRARALAMRTKTMGAKDENL